jgi:hypothetical protein
LEVDIPADTPDSDGVFVAGTFNKWNLLATPVARYSTSHAAVTIPVDVGQELEYKYTRGTWWQVEKRANGSELPNRRYAIKEDCPASMTIHDTVESWNDLLVKKESLAQMKKQLALAVDSLDFKGSFIAARALALMGDEQGLEVMCRGAANNWPWFDPNAVYSLLSQEEAVPSLYKVYKTTHSGNLYHLLKQTQAGRDALMHLDSDEMNRLSEALDMLVAVPRTTFKLKSDRVYEKREIIAAYGYLVRRQLDTKSYSTGLAYDPVSGVCFQGYKDWLSIRWRQHVGGGGSFLAECVLQKLPGDIFVPVGNEWPFYQSLDPIYSS